MLPVNARRDRFMPACANAYVLSVYVRPLQLGDAADLHARLRGFGPTRHYVDRGPKLAIDRIGVGENERYVRLQHDRDLAHLKRPA
jgi:hypothetical protein